MKKTASILLVICLILSLITVTALADSSAQVVVLSENLVLENISYDFSESGSMMISATVTGPSNIAEVRIGSWWDDQPTAEEARETAEYMVSIWKQSQNSFSEKTLPYNCYTGRPVDTEDLGKTQYIILVGMDTSVNYVGYAVLKADIPGSTEPDTPSPVALSENLTLEDVCYEVAENGYMQISATVTGPSNLAEVLIGGWMDYQPTAESARQMAEQMVSIWKQHHASMPERELPFECYNSRPVSESDLGKTQYVVMVGVDTDVNYVGFSVIKVDIPDSLDPDTPAPDSFSENLTLENVSFEFNEGGFMVINATATGPSNVVVVRLSGWMDSRPTAVSARQMTKDMVSRWKQSQSSFPERDLPFDISNRIYLSAEDYGKTVYLIMAGMDTNADYVGYAVFKVDIPEGSDSFTVSFDTNGGSTLEDQVVPKGSQAVRPDTPTKDGYWFGGWFRDESLSILYDFDTAVTEDTVLYAKWVAPDFVLPTGLTTIDEAAFSGDAFTFVVLPENIETIAAGTFADCPYLSYIYIPAGIQSIHAEAFGDIQNLTILGFAGSPAEVYAQTHGFAFIDVS